MRLFGLALAGAFIAASLPAAAAVVETHRYGHWTAIEGTTGNGSRVCGVSTGGRTASPKYVGVKFFPDRGQLDVHIGKSSWSIPSGTSVPVQIEFNGSSGSWSTAQATGNGEMVTLSINPQRAANFLVEFSLASHGVIRFGGDEAPWTMNLAGSNAAVRAMLGCIQRARGVPPSTQPLASVPPPSNSSAPTMPYTPSAEPPPSRPGIGIGRERRT